MMVRRMPGVMSEAKPGRSCMRLRVSNVALLGAILLSVEGCAVLRVSPQLTPTAHINL